MQEMKFQIGGVKRQNREKIDNLTPETAFVPNFTEEEAFEGSGKWNDNPVVLEAGTYYVVYIKFADTKAVAVIAK